MTAFQETTKHPTGPRERVPGYEDPAWDYGNPFGQVKMPPVRLPWHTLASGGGTQTADSRATQGQREVNAV